MEMKTKKFLLEENESLKRDNEQLKQSNENLRYDVLMYKRGEQSGKDKIESLNLAVSSYKKEAEGAKKQAAEYKHEIDGLSDTKAVLEKLMSIMRSPHNDYNKVIGELNDMLKHERMRANALENELRSIQIDMLQNQFLNGKVQAYEMMLKVAPIEGITNA